MSVTFLLFFLLLMVLTLKFRAVPVWPLWGHRGLHRKLPTSSEENLWRSQPKIILQRRDHGEDWRNGVPSSTLSRSLFFYFSSLWDSLSDQISSYLEIGQSQSALRSAEVLGFWGKHAHARKMTTPWTIAKMHRRTGSLKNPATEESAQLRLQVREDVNNGHFRVRLTVGPPPFTVRFLRSFFLSFNMIVCVLKQIL